MSARAARNRGRLTTTLCALVLAQAFTPVFAEDSATPLLDYAQDVSLTSSDRESILTERLEYARHQVERHSVPEADCARTLGAARFAAMLDELGIAQSALGDHEGASEAFRRAIACSPRAAYLHADLASELMYLRRYDEARGAVQEGLTIEQDEPALHSVLAKIDFIEERWPDAIRRLRELIAAPEDPDQALYLHCLLWLAERRSGIGRPDVQLPEHEGQWPVPIFDALRGELTEDDLAETIRAEPDIDRRREQLAEALFYLGQKRLTLGETEAAQRYFEAATRLKVQYFAEHHMALAELAKMRSPTADVSGGD